MQADATVDASTTQATVKDADAAAQASKPATGSGIKPPPKQDPADMTHEQREEQRRREREIEANKFPRGVQVDFKFDSAELNTDPGAKLSHLSFTFDNWTDDVKATLKISDASGKDSTKLGLGWVSMRVYPQLAGPEYEALGSGKVGRYAWVGRYVVELFDANNTSLGSVFVMLDGALQQGNSSGKYMQRVSRDPGTGRLSLLSFQKQDGKTLGQEVLKLRWNTSGFAEHRIRDAAGNNFEYRFPSGSLELIPPGEDD